MSHKTVNSKCIIHSGHSHLPKGCLYVYGLLQAEGICVVRSDSSLIYLFDYCTWQRQDNFSKKPDAVLFPTSSPYSAVKGTPILSEQKPSAPVRERKTADFWAAPRPAKSPGQWGFHEMKHSRAAGKNSKTGPAWKPAVLRDLLLNWGVSQNLHA